MWCFRAAVGRRICVHCCCCSSVAQRRRSTAQNEHPCLPTILTPSSPTYRLTIYHIFFRSRPANPIILSSPSHTALCGHDFFGFDPTVWSVPYVVEGTSQAIPRPGDAIAVRCTCISTSEASPIIRLFRFGMWPVGDVLQEEDAATATYLGKQLWDRSESFALRSNCCAQ
jgi:hypothetical protein